MAALTPAPALTTKHVAERCGVNPATVRDWVKRGLVTPMVLPSGRLRFSEADVLAMLARRAA